MACAPKTFLDGKGNHVRFATAHAARSLGWATTDLLLAWHLHSVVGFSGTTVSILLALFLSTGALANLSVGILLTVRKATGPDYVRVQLFGAIATAILFAGQFLVVDSVAVTVIAFAFRIVYAAQDVPQNALGSLLPDDDSDAKRYARLRVVLSGVMRVVAVSVHLLLYRGAADVIAFAVIGGLNVASAIGLRGLRFPNRPTVRPTADEPATSWPTGLPKLLLGFVVAAAVLPTMSRLLIFAPSSDGGMLQAGGSMLTAFCVGSVAGPFAQRRLVDAFGERIALMTGIVVILASAMLVTFGDGVPVRALAAAAHGAGLGIVGVHLWTSAARVAMDDAASGTRRDGMVASAVILTTHVSMAAGALLLAPLIDSYEAGDPVAALAALVIVAVGGIVLALTEMPLRRRIPPVAA